MSYEAKAESVNGGNDPQGLGARGEKLGVEDGRALARMWAELTSSKVSQHGQCVRTGCGWGGAQASGNSGDDGWERWKWNRDSSQRPGTRFTLTTGLEAGATTRAVLSKRLAAAVDYSVHNSRGRRAGLGGRVGGGRAPKEAHAGPHVLRLPLAIRQPEGRTEQ
ncbi:hypothetical protein CC78DRAFT_577597 [Lojkania enalia]|uniref:Uncharacterized protein n=1 Tax=Lojkania enalia TaxID=147567 RepID=A0A9P4KD67_9PLEO|nr:hypothetical protein CC78DRAFT_577597 [Didymosphaeria enalia]